MTSSKTQTNHKVDIVQTWLNKVPYATFLGIAVDLLDDELVFVLPQHENLIGNPSLPSIHGGVIGAFMEQAATFHLLASMEQPVLPKIINFSLDYLRATRVQETFAQCNVTRQGRFIANVSITAWQDDKASPTSIARAHFLIPENETQE